MDVLSKVEFWQVDGEVLDTDRYSETHVQTRGGGGYARAPSVRVSQTAHQDVWIRENDGHERAIQLEGTNIPLRPSQRITVVCAQRRDNGTGWMCALINHATGQTHEIISPKVLQQRLRLVRITGLSFILALAVAALIVFLTKPPSGYFAHPWRMAEWGWAIAAGVVVLCLGGWRKSRLAGRAAKALKAHIDAAITRAKQT
ncbi:hypothetical protein [Halomonas dongshanensis]|uniref:Uncharacterized protein n=1 Tax=Halomonas dongshanensis TaxID=2890835 RepID=A0ABT2EHD8_9GAMM|nr:hypothetical protein [Halomonas dongshanensis]MCS2611022.1 hypothetical protein [Halomonas dongshanensis]